MNKTPRGDFEAYEDEGVLEEDDVGVDGWDHDQLDRMLSCKRRVDAEDRDGMW